MHVGRDDEAAVGDRPRALRDEGLVAERLPAFLREMRHHRREAMDENVAGLGEGGAQIVADRRLADRADRRAELVGQFVDRGDAHIEAQPLDLVLDSGQRRMGDPADALRLVAVARRRRRPLRPDDALDLAGQAPQALDLLERALNAVLGPDDVALGRRIRQHEPARRVGAVGRDDLVGIDGVALRLRHFLDRADLDRLVAREEKGAARLSARFDANLGGRKPLAVRVAIGLVHHHALGEQAGERLVEIEVAALAHGAREEARIEKMQDRVLDAADILVDRQPVIGHLGIVGRRRVGRVGEAHEIPRRIDERIHRVGLARRRVAAGGQATCFQVGWRSSGLPG